MSRADERHLLTRARITGLCIAGAVAVPFFAGLWTIARSIWK